MLGSFAGVADYGAFVFAIIVFLAIPGPGNLALITSTGKGGIAGGMGATFGVIAGDQVLLRFANLGFKESVMALAGDRKSTRLNSRHVSEHRMPSSA